MFRFKFIKKDALDALLKKIELLEKNDKEWSNLHERRVADLNSLRKQNRELRMANNRLTERNNDLEAFKRDTLQALGNLDLGSFCLKLCTSKCDICNKEQSDCEKYTFGDLTFCKVPK